MNAAGARSLRRAGLGFRLRLSALARGGGSFSSSRFARVPVDGLTGSAASSLALSPRLERLLSLGVLDSNEGWDCWKIGRKKNASAGPGLPTVAARVAAKTTAAP